MKPLNLFVRIVGRKHDGTYGSGRFCSDHCRRSYSAKKVIHHTCNFNSAKTRAPYGTWICCYCGYISETRKLLGQHRKEQHPEVYGKVRSSWNKGLTKETNTCLKKMSETYKQHLKEGKFNPPQLGKPLSLEIKQKISNSMKKAHKEGRAHNIGKSRWNNEPSYPEKWFMKMLKQEFNFICNRDYVKELPFHKFSLDFAWPEMKKCIEIDGQQHDRDIKQQQRDIEKNKLLYNENWKLLRIKWQDIFHNSKYWIEEVKKFINS